VTVLIDTSAWIEFFFGSKKGVEVNKIIKSDEPIVSNPIIEFEVLNNMAKRRTIKIAEAALAYVRACSNRIDLYPEIVSESVKVRLTHKLGLADSFVYGTASKTGAKLITADNDFRRLKGVEVL
jgi:predicted nucleic acid-binding protein